MEQEKNNMTAIEGFEKNDKRLTEDFLAKEREKRNIYFKGFVTDKSEKEGYSDSQRHDVAEWLKEAYELGKKDGNTEAIEDQVKNNLQGFDPVKIFDNLVIRMREVMAPSYFEKLLQCEKIVSDTRAVQVSLLMDKIEEQRKSSPLSWITGGMTGTDATKNKVNDKICCVECPGKGASEKNTAPSNQGVSSNAFGFGKAYEAYRKDIEVPCGV